ncbi:MAG: radical SAM protein [Clostridiales bacterium]|jgi:pyruvate formate lyase activating enzyme|nr:radical SAM protein [Clostridiales bacterium]
MKGSVFNIEEFSVFDGPGIRTCVFFKGCPLRCNWCHNPEGLRGGPQRIQSADGTERIVGEEEEASVIADKVLKNAEILRSSGGGVTFSGGEALAQPEFLLEMLTLTKGLHRAIETSGYASNEVFSAIINTCDLVIMDIKHTDAAIHKRFTGVDPVIIRENFDLLKKSKIPFILRVPLIPEITDTAQNLSLVAELAQGAENLIQVELLPYHKAGGKYKSVGMVFSPDFNEELAVNVRLEIFKQKNTPASVL